MSSSSRLSEAPVGCEYLINVFLLLTGVFVNMIHGRIVTSQRSSFQPAASLRQSQPAGSLTPPLPRVRPHLVPLQDLAVGARPGHSLPSFHGTQGGNQRPRFMLGLDHSSLTGLWRRRPTTTLPRSRGLTQASYSRRRGQLHGKTCLLPSPTQKQAHTRIVDHNYQTSSHQREQGRWRCSEGRARWKSRTLGFFCGLWCRVSLTLGSHSASISASTSCMY